MGHTIAAHTSVVADREWTVDDLRLLPEDYRCELVEGVLYMAAMPAWPHATVVENIRDIIGPWVRSRKLGRVVGPQAGIYLNERNYIDPDLIFLRHDQFPEAGERPRSAVLAVEVLSPSNLRIPQGERLRMLEQANVEEIWFVDTGDRSLEVWRLLADGYQLVAHFHGADEVSSLAIPGLVFPLIDCWADIVNRMH